MNDRKGHIKIKDCGCPRDSNYAEKSPTCLQKCTPVQVKLFLKIIAARDFCKESFCKKTTFWFYLFAFFRFILGGKILAQTTAPLHWSPPRQKIPHFHNKFLRLLFRDKMAGIPETDHLCTGKCADPPDPSPT